MTLEQLRVFLAVAEHLHFTNAAEVLHLTQPAVSAAVQSLETEYGVKLFHRIGRRIEMTDAGALLQSEAKKILNQVMLTERGLRELNDLQRGELKIGSSLTIGNYWLPDKISAFKQRYPGIFVNCTLSNAEDICEGTAIGLFDLGIVTGEVKPSLRNTLEQQIVGSDRLQIVVGKMHPWFEQPEIDLSDLINTSWIMRESGSGAQQIFEQALQLWGIDAAELNVVLVLNSSEMVKAVVESGIGAAAIPELMVKKEIQLDTLRAVTVIDRQSKQQKPLTIAQSVLLLKHRKRFNSRLVLAFEEVLTASPIEKVS